MDKRDTFSNSSFVSGFQSRIRALSKNYNISQPRKIFTLGKLPAVRRYLFSALLLATALILAFWTREITRNELQKEWERTHFPSKTIWRHAMEMRGFKQIQDPVLMHRVLRNLPLDFKLDEECSILLSTNMRWLAISLSSNRDDTAVYTSDNAANRKPPQLQWTRLSSGWRGFEEVLGQIDKSPNTTDIPTIKYRYSDPRAIHY